MKRFILIALLLLVFATPLYAFYGQKKLIAKLYPRAYRIDDYVVGSAIDEIIKKVNELIDEVETMKDKISELEVVLMTSKYR